MASMSPLAGPLGICESGSDLDRDLAFSSELVSGRPLSVLAIAPGKCELASGLVSVSDSALASDRASDSALASDRALIQQWELSQRLELYPVWESKASR